MSRTCPQCQTAYGEEILHCPEDGQNLAGVPVVDELIGRTIGSYRVDRLLGRGGMGAVYMGVHPGIGSRVAIKFLHPQYANDDAIVDRFFNEARAVNVIGHDNILKILDLNVTEDNRHYFVMEFLHGRPLQSLLKPGEPLGLDVTGPILLQICEALQAAHARGIIHRDLKPDNVYLIAMKGKKNFVKIVDFGIARVTDEAGVSTGQTQTGMVMGTPSYMSPEQAGGVTSKIDGRSDVYSLGVMMFQLATGKLPFPGASFGEVLIGHLQTPPPAPRSINPAIPGAYEALILKCLEKEQEARFQSMTELHDALWATMQALGISRELPVATEADLELPPIDSKPPGSARTPSQPGRSTGPGRPRTGGARIGPRPRSSAPPPDPTRVLSEPDSSRNLRPIALAAALLIAVGVGGLLYFLKRSDDRAAAATALAEKLAVQDERREAQPPAAAAPAQPVPTTSRLDVQSDPLEVDVAASWPNGGTEQGRTPLVFSVPRGARVHLEFSRRGYLPYALDVLADDSQTVRAALKPQPAAASFVPPPRVARKHREKPAARNQPSDGLIDVLGELK